MNGGRKNLSPSACWGQIAYTKYLESHPDYTINPGSFWVFDSPVSRGSNRHTCVCFRPPTRGFAAIISWVL